MSAEIKKEDAYSQAVASGRYVRESGLHGKYDNVRIFWEDEVTRLFLRPHLETRLRRQSEKQQGARIIDLGCGSGDGFELLMDMTRSDAGLNDNQVNLIPDAALDQYTGIELNRDLLAQNAERWGEDDKMACAWGDLSQGLPVEEGEPPFDLYLASYGTLSHFHEDQTIELFADIARHADDGALILGDWLGRHSYEWQQLWDVDISREQWMDYVISYIYPEDQRDNIEFASLDLRLLVRDEIDRIVRRVEEETGFVLEISHVFDRSLFVGRHMDTGDYNPHLKPLRSAVNSLFERNLRTDLERLLIGYQPHPDFPALNGFFEQFRFCWNDLVQYAIALCRAVDRKTNADPPPTNTSEPDALKKARDHIGQVMRGIGCFSMEDPRSNVLEPQLGYALRSLEMSLQQGVGHGHGLVGVFTVKKP